MRSRNVKVFIIRYFFWHPLIAAMGCSPSNQVMVLKTDLSNALRAVFAFSTEKKASISIEFWNPEDSVHYISAKTNNQLYHEITLMNLKPQTTYHYFFITEFKDRLIQSEEKKFRTDSLPGYLPSMNLMIDSGEVFTGYVLIRNVQAPA
jgi:hypothetical protein